MDFQVARDLRVNVVRYGITVSLLLRGFFVHQLIKILLSIFISLAVTGSSNVTIMVLSLNASRFFKIKFVISSNTN